MKAYETLAGIYDPWMAHFDYDRWAGYLWAFLQEQGVRPGDRGLELACGTGLITLRMAQRGCRMTALDSSDAMLTRAAEKAARAGLRVQWLHMDMRCTKVHQPVDFALCVCDGVNYLTTLEAVDETFTRVFNALRPGGWFLFDVSSRDKLLSMDGQFYSQETDEAACLWRNHLDQASEVLTLDLVLFTRQTGELYRRSEERHRQRAHTREELEERLSKAGFTDIRCYGAFTLDPPREGAQRIQFMARHPL